MVPPTIEAKVERSYYVRMAVLGVLSAGVGFLLIVHEYRQWARFLDAEGVTRRDGRRFSWKELREIRCVRNLVHGVPGMLNHVELLFGRRKVKVFPLVIVNAGEVMRFLMTLPGGDEVRKHWPGPAPRPTPGRT